MILCYAFLKMYTLLNKQALFLRVWILMVG